MTYRFHLWALTGTVVWCALLGLVAWALVRSFPRHRGLVLTVFLFSNVGQCMPYLRVAFVDWMHDPGNPMWFFNVLCFATFAFIATPFSILWVDVCLILSRNVPNRRIVRAILEQSISTLKIRGQNTAGK